MVRSFALVLVLLSCAAGHAQTTVSFHPRPRHPVSLVPPVGREPPGALPFCLSQPQDCQNTEPQPAVETAAADAAAQLLAHTVGVQVNNAIWSDARWGKQPALFAEWKIGPVSGVCHDYAVTKLDLLLKAGMRRDALALAWLRVGGASHLVLLVKIGGEIFVLDSLNDTLRKIGDEPPSYVWISRQAWNTPVVWVQMASQADPLDSPGPTSSASRP
jgi:predicted transglutaminase-like cysteine proteinase